MLLYFYLIMKVAKCLQRAVDNTRAHVYDISRQLITMEMIFWIEQKTQGLRTLNGK